MIDGADELGLLSGPDMDVDDTNFVDDDEDKDVKRLEEELIKRKADVKKKKANKVSVRQDIDTMRVNAPSAPVKIVSKRPSSESEANPPSTKRVKQTEIGGLKANWKPIVYGNKMSSTSKSLANEAGSTEIEFEELAGGEFAQDTAKEVIEAKRAGKSHKKEAHTSKEVIKVKLEPADVNLIANEERETGKPAQPPKPRATVKAQSQIRNYRSKVGQRGLQAVIQHLQGNAKGVEAEKQLVLQLRHKDSCIYEKPGSTPASSTGAFRGKLIMRTFAFYLTWALDAPTVEEKLPAGALALATTAVYRALDVCKNGIPPSDQKTTPAPTRPGRNTLDSFNEDWAPSCQRFYDLIIKMKDEQTWGQGNLGGGVTAAMAEDEGETIVLSD
ncbi:hypothetical protein BT96DRAFT_935859 [Gymnopus androsaceus JB14]|uniref:DUF6532 domain-containing protein n=1 Tax=Gymnopus androsaceus JB14 TaxID=1447944 RepID=A0A6A4I292_9AGAR|nr:hypothetical protein BT96DRAFT_935859 [Gymnopus androsaceus JB14]